MPQDTDQFAITAPAVFDGERFLSDHCVIVRGQTVAQLLPAGECPAGISPLVLDRGILAPGLIDLQVNGGGGLLLTHAPQAATVDTMLAAHRVRGTTAMLPTVMSAAPEVQRAAVDAVREAGGAGSSGILGVHLEGPFFNPARCGAHAEALIRAPREEDIDWLCSLQDLVTLVTLAPEQCAAGQIARLAGCGVRVCAGHTEATHGQILDAAAQGLHGITHLFNAMRPATAREPGTVGAALEQDTLWAGIIADGHHVHPANIRLAYRSKPTGKLVLVSDAMATVGSAEQTFELYGETIRASGGRLANSRGRLAGSAIGMIDAVQYTAAEVGLPLSECLRMASLYPAAVLGLEDTLGRVAAGYRADLVHFDERFNVHNTWMAGRRQAHCQT